MTSACGCDSAPAAPEELDAPPRPWWRDPELLIPLASGIALALAFIVDVATPDPTGPARGGSPAAETISLTLYWAALLLGASQFVPGALKSLFTKGSLGIGLLMTISAAGAVALGFTEEAAALAFLYSISEALEDKAMDGARRGLRSLLRLLPDRATLVADSCCGGRTHTEVAVADIVPGDVVLVRAGERVPTDGTLRHGHAAHGQAVIDASAVTGESIPVPVPAGGAILAGSVNAGAVIEVEATAPGDDNSLTGVVELVERAQEVKGRRARLADRIARPLVPGVLILAVVVAAVGSLFGDPHTWIVRALVVLVAASPCALAISVPVTVISAIGAASRLGVAVKSGAAFERFGSIRHVALDKTGTLTRNSPAVTAVRAADGPGAPTEADVLALAAALERHSTHPLATAIVAAADGPLPAATGVTETAGLGLTGEVDGARITVGSPRHIAAGEFAPEVEALEEAGNTVVVVHRDGEPAGLIAVRDELRPEAAETVASLADAGIAATMLTGDNARTARALAQRAGIGDVRAELSPTDKAAAVGELSRRRPVAMVGDGINDAPALASADVGIAMGAGGSHAAIESADVAITGHDLRALPRALAHARRSRRIMVQNIGLSLLIIAVLPPLALTGVLGLAAVVLIHEVGEIIVIANGLRAARVGGVAGAGAIRPRA